MKRAELAAACALDLLLGDPHELPHPVRAIGAAIDALDRRRRPRAPNVEIVHGAAVVVAIVGTSALFAHLLARKRPVARIALAASALAARSLLATTERVRAALDAGDLNAARAAVRHLVGRDVDQLDESEVARAALEALAESLGDGVAAPLVALVAGGCAGALAFKAISTLDSMIGHRERPYTWFGRVAARTDDVANVVPSRLAALAIAAAAALTGEGAVAAARIALCDAGRHASPNAGWPEAALAGALGVRLGGTNRYAGRVTPGAVFNVAARTPEAADVARGMVVVAIACVLLELAAVAVCRR